MTDRADMEESDFVQAHSLSEFKLKETQFRSGLMVSNVAEDSKDGTSAKTDQNSNHRQQASSSGYGGVQYGGTQGWSTQREQQWEGHREVTGVVEQTDSMADEDDEKEQYKFLYLADKSGVSVAPSLAESSAGGQRYQLPPQQRKESVEGTLGSASELEKALRDKEKELRDKMEDNKILKDNVHKFLDKFNLAQEEVEMKNREISELTGKVQTLQDTLGKKEAELEKKERDNNQLREDLQAAKEDLQAAKKGGTTSRGRNSVDEKMHIKLNQTMGRCKDLEKKLQFEQDQVETYKKQVDEMHRRLSEMQCDKNAKTEEQVQQYEKEKAEFEEKMQTLEDNLQQKSLDLAEEARKCQSYQTDLAKKQEEWENQRERFNQEKGLLMKAKQELEQERSKQTMQLRDLEQSLHIEKEEKVKIRSEVHELLERTKSYETQLHTLQVEKKETEDICTGFQKATEQTLLSIDQLKEKSDKDSKMLMEQKTKITSYMKKIEDMRADKTELLTANEKMVAEIDVLNMEKKKLEKNIKTVQDGILAVKLAADENETGFHAEREARTKDKANYEAKIRQMKMEIEDLNTKLQNMSSRNDSLARDKKHLMEQLNAFAATQCHDTFS